MAKAPIEKEIKEEISANQSGTKWPMSVIRLQGLERTSKSCE